MKHATSWVWDHHHNMVLAYSHKLICDALLIFPCIGPFLLYRLIGDLFLTISQRFLILGLETTIFFLQGKLSTFSNFTYSCCPVLCAHTATLQSWRDSIKHNFSRTVTTGAAGDCKDTVSQLNCHQGEHILGVCYNVLCWDSDSVVSMGDKCQAIGDSIFWTGSNWL